MKIKYNLILTLAVMLTMAQTAWAVTVEETVTWPMDGTGVSGNIVSNGTGNSLALKYESWFGHTAAKFTSINGIDGNYLVTLDKQQEISFPDITGTVVKVEVKGFCFNNGGLNLYAGTSMSNLLNKETGGTAYPSWDENGQYNQRIIVVTIETDVQSCVFDTELSVVHVSERFHIRNLSERGGSRPTALVLDTIGQRQYTDGHLH